MKSQNCQKFPEWKEGRTKGDRRGKVRNLSQCLIRAVLEKDDGNFQFVFINF